MAHFAKIENNIVVDVIVADIEFIEQYRKIDDSLWIQTFYQETPTATEISNGNYAGIGYSYNPDKNIFIPIKPYNSWILDEENNIWIAPKPKPSSFHYWNEVTLDWEIS